MSAGGVSPEVVARQADQLGRDLRELAEPLAGQLRGRLQADVGTVYLTGAGDSYHAGCAAELAFETFARVACEPLSAQRFLEYGVPAMRHSPGQPLVVAASASGRTPRVVAALERAREHGALTIAITGAADSPAARAADHSVLVAPPDLKRAPGVRTFQASLLGLLLVALELAEARGHDVWQSRVELARLPDAIEATAAAARERCLQAASALAASPVSVVVGSGPAYGIALFAAAKLVETAGIAAMPQDLDEWWHVERRVRPAEAPVVVIAPPGRSHARAVDVVAAARSSGRPVLAVAAEDDDELATRASLVVPVCGEAREELSPLLYHVFAAATAAAAAEQLGRLAFEDHRLGAPQTLDDAAGTAAAVAAAVARHAPPEVARRPLEPDTELAATGLDSLALVALVVELEERFAIEFPADILEPETFRSIRTITSAVDALRGA